MEYKVLYIDGEKTKYLISEYGDIINSKTNHCLKPQLNKDGYYTIKLSHNGKEYTKVVHKLVAEMYIANPDNKPEIHHKDKNRINNHYSNLVRCTRKEHFDLEREEFGKFTRAKGEKHGSSKYSDKLIRSAAIDLSNGISIHDVSKKYDIDKPTLYRLCSRQTRSYLTEDLILPKFNNPKKDTYSNELKNSILELLKLNYSPKEIAIKLDLEYTPKLKNYIKTMRNRKINKKIRFNDYS